MARRSNSKGLGYYAIFWIAPMFAVVLAPFFLHAATVNLSESTDDHLFIVFVLFLTTVSLSVVGCVLDETCACPKGFALVLMIIQLTLLAGAVVLRSMLFQLASTSHGGITFARFLARGPSQPTAPLPATQAVAGSQAQSATFSHDAAAADLQLQAVDLQDLQDSVAQSAAKNAAPAVALPGWTDAGDGYCEDGETHEEFSSLHAGGKSMQACAEAGLSDRKSIAFDYSDSDGDCDIRYPAGVTSDTIDGYEWWGWGAGLGTPAGSGKQKHNRPTHCFAKVVVPTKPPPPGSLTAKLHPAIKELIREYPFQPVRTDRGELVNIILVRSPFRSPKHDEQVKKYKDEILFLGISSFEDYPLPPPNPFSGKFPRDKYLGMFPGFLHMMREPEKVFPRDVKLLLMSQSDFSIPGPQPAVPKVYDFAFSGSDQDVYNDCVGWSSFAKNWSFVKQALEVMCGELGMTGVLVATKDKQDRKACSIPSSCEGKVKQTTYLTQDSFFAYVKQSRFLFVPQVHDASPRVTTQALALDVPMLMNRNIIGGWKYLNEKTGEFFNDLADFRESAQKILRNAKAGGVYEPRQYVDREFGDGNSGMRLRKFVEDNFEHRVKLPEGTRLLLPSGA